MACALPFFLLSSLVTVLAGPACDDKCLAHHEGHAAAAGAVLLLQTKTSCGEVSLLQTFTLMHKNESLAASEDTGPGPHVGVLMGYSDESMVAPGSPGALSLALARHWAERQNYSFFLEPRLGSLTEGGREPPAWDKLAAFRRFLPRVDVLLWLDLDVFVLDPSRRVEDLLRRDRGSCARSGRPDQDALLAARPEELFLWGATAENVHLDGRTLKHGPPTFRLNLCTGAFALSNDPRSFKLLDDAWHEPHVNAWPYEQGGIWTALLRSEDMLARTCILNEDTFVYESLESADRALLAKGRGSFALHATGIKGPKLESGRLALARAVCDEVFGDQGGCPRRLL